LDNNLKGKLFPFSLTAGIIFLDQITKMLVVRFIGLNTMGFSFFGDFLRIIHRRNPAVAFSLGSGFPDSVRLVLFTILPVIVLIGLTVFYFRTKEINRLQRWAMAAVLGGGIGNIIDRIFRPDGVVDFIDVKFYGIFGWERWPTFNVADSSVVVAGIILIIAFIIEERRLHNEQKT